VPAPTPTPPTGPPALTGGLRLVLTVHLVALGAGYAVGPAQLSSGASFTVIKQLGPPIPLWGAVFVPAAVLLAAGRYTLGHGLAFAVLLFWGGGLAGTVATGQLTGWGAPVHTLSFAALHALRLWRRSRARVGGGASGSPGSPDGNPHRPATDPGRDAGGAADG
jgi:hypothetical protein